MEIYINDSASFLPNAPVSNDDMEKVLGIAGGVPSRTRKIILRNNGITTRYYALDPETGRPTHTNAELTAEAVRRLDPRPGFDPSAIECLCCGTSTPDQIMPGHGLMVHGELGDFPCEVMTSSGICLSGITALKYACMNLETGQVGNAVATGSETASSFIRATMCGPVTPERAKALEHRRYLSFEADFLRWMLSDGAGALFLERRPRGRGPSLKVEWIEVVSHAGHYPACMYAGAQKLENGRLKGWREYEDLHRAVDDEAFLIKQDARLLNQEILTVCVEKSLPRLVQKYGLRVAQIDWFLPHYSSEYFRKGLYDHYKSIGFEIPWERWFTNLTTKGNTGAAAIYVMLDELRRSGRLEKGQRILCFIPESGRFSIGYMFLSVV